MRERAEVGRLRHSFEHRPFLPSEVCLPSLDGIVGRESDVPATRRRRRRDSILAFRDQRSAGTSRDRIAVGIDPSAEPTCEALVTQRRRVVTKNKLLNTTWGDRFVGESALTHHRHRIPTGPGTSNRSGSVEPPMVILDDDTDSESTRTRTRLEDELHQCDRRTTKYRTLIDDGVDTNLVAGWLKEVTAARKIAERRLAELNHGTNGATLDRDEVRHLLNEIGGMTGRLADGNPADRAQF